MANFAVYIRNRDRHKLPVKDYSRDEGVILTRYLSTRAKAKRLHIHLYIRNGTYIGNLGKEKK